MIRTIILVLLAIVLAACEKQGPIQPENEVETLNNASVKTVDFYVEHDDERAHVSLLCDQNPGLLQKNGNCINATAAKRKIDGNAKGRTQFDAVTFGKQDDEGQVDKPDADSKE